MNHKSSAMGVAVLATSILMVYSGTPPSASLLEKETLEATITERAATPPTQKQPQEADAKADGATELIRDFLGVPATQELGPQTLTAQFKTEVQCLIATVPDPEHSRLPFLFDIYLDAIQRAAETAGFVQDRIKMPWKKERTPIEPVLTVAEKKAAREERERMERVPGMILFRHEGKGTSNRKLLLLFLVGETPTGGIYKNAMTNALQQAAKFTPGKAPEFRLLGPALSGSATSISLCVRNWLHTLPADIHPTLTFIGTATALNRQKFKDDMLRDQPARATITWHGTVIPDDVARRAFYQHLLGKLETIKNPASNASQEYEVAFLTEGSTAYGQSQRPDKLKAPEAVNHDSIKVLNLTFPLHIARLRSVTWKNGGSRNASNKAPFNLQSSMTPLPLEEDQETTIPVFSAVSASYAEVALATILEEIERQKIRYLGIAATDVRDRLFLAHEIRRHSPNLVLFFMSSELLFLHPEVNRELQGSLLVSTYPLAPQNKLWSQSYSQQGKWLQFPVQSAQGVYNATLALLKHEAAMQEYETPIFGKSTEQETTGPYPTLWLSVVGRDNIWPLATLPVSEHLSALQEEREKGVKPDTYVFARTIPPPSENSRERLHSEAAFIAFYLFVLVVCLLPTYGVFAGWGEFLKTGYAKLAELFHGQVKKSPPPHKQEEPKQNLPWNWGWMIFGDLVDSKNHNLHLRRKVYLAGCLLAMLCLSLPVWLISAIPIKYSGYRESFSNIDQWLIQGGFSCASLVVALHLIALCVILRELVVRHTANQAWRALVFLFVFLLALLCTTLPVWLLIVQPLTKEQKGYWQSLSPRNQWLILGVVGIALLVFLYHLLKQLQAKRAPRVRQAKTIRQTTFKTMFLRAGRRVFKPKPTNNQPYSKRDFGVLAILVLGLPLTSLILLGLHFLPNFLRGDKAELILLWERTVGNFSGISPLLPLALIATGTLTWTLCCLRRLRLLERKPLISSGKVFSSPQLSVENYYELEFLALETKGISTAPDTPPVPLESEGIARLEQQLHKMMSCSLNQLPGWFWTALTVVTACMMMMGARLMPSVEGLWFNRGITALFILAYLAIALNFLRFLSIWVALNRLLHRLSWHPLLLGYHHPTAEKDPALGRLRLDLSSPLPTFTTLTKSVEQARLLWRTLQVKTSIWAVQSRLDLIKDAEQGLNQAMTHDANDEWAEAFAARNQVRTKLIELSKSVAVLVRPYWITEAQGGADLREKQPEAPPAIPTLATPGQTLMLSALPGATNWTQTTPLEAGRKTKAHAEQAMLEQAERFLISRLIGFLQYVLAQMQNLVVFVTIGTLLMLGAVLSYPFQPMSPLLIFNWVTISGVVAITMLVFVQMNRNPTLSLLSGTKPGELDWNGQFVLQIAVHGLLPLLAITGVQFSDSIREVMTWPGVAGQGAAH